MSKKVSLALVASIIITAPLEKISWKIGFTLRPVMLLSLIAFYLWAIQVCLNGYRPGREVKTLAVLFSLMVLSFLLSSTNSIDPIISTRHIVLYLTLFLLSFVVIESVRNSEKLELLVKIWMGTGVLMCCYGIAQFVGLAYGYDIDKVFFGLLYSQPEPFTLDKLQSPLKRSYSLFGDANNYAGYLCTVVPFFFCSALYCARKRIIGKQISLIFLTWFVMASFILTLSRSGGIGIAAILVTAVFLKHNELFRHGILPFWVINLFLVVLLIWQFGGTIVPLIAARLSETQSSGVHLYVATSALKLFGMSPVTGVGLGNFGNAYGTFFRPGFEFYNAHSAYLTILSETGIVGFTVYLCFYGFVMKCILDYRRAVTGYAREVMADGLFLGFIGLLSANIFYQNFTYQFFWVFMSLAVAARLSVSKTVLASESTRRDSRSRLQLE